MLKMTQENHTEIDCIAVAQYVIATEISGLKQMENNLDTNFCRAVEAIYETSGRTIVCGMGKSGIIGKKIAASFASTGTPSFFMHPGEAFHGDLGMIRPEDVFVAISNSGETEEVLRLLPFLEKNGNFLVAMTGNPESTLGRIADCHLNVSVAEEACPLRLAPTSSTTAALVMGDALTVVLMKKRNFSVENFARLHPGGRIGKWLLGKVCDEMIVENLPVVPPDEFLPSVIGVISEGRLGMTLVTDEGMLKGIITDGDLRRAIEKFGKTLFDLQAKDICTNNPVTVSPETSVKNAYDIMDQKKISALIVMENKGITGVFKR